MLGGLGGLKRAAINTTYDGETTTRLSDWGKFWMGLFLQSRRYLCTLDRSHDAL